MKKLITIILLLCVSSIFAQVDTVIFTNTVEETITIEKADTISDWVTYQIHMYNPNADSTWKDYSGWIQTHEKQITPNLVKKRFIRHRINDQGYKQKQFKIVKYQTKTITRRKIRR